MRSKILLMLVLFVFSLLLPACSCKSWTTFWGEDSCEKCATHWKWREKCEEPITTPCQLSAVSTKCMTYPVCGREGEVLSLEKISPTEVFANQNFEYRLKVTNLTKSTVSNVIVKDTMPGNMKVKSSMPRINTLESGHAQWHLGDFGPKESKMITVQAVAEGTGSIRSCAEVSYDTPICAKIKILEPNIKLTKFAPEESLVCDRIPVRYVVTNSGTGNACGITIKETLPAGLVSAEGNNQISFSVDTLSPGESSEFKVMLDAQKVGQYSGQGMAMSGNTSSAESNLTTTRIVQPMLVVKQSCPSDKFIGKDLEYEIMVTNTGNGTARNAELVASVPDQTQFIDASENGLYTHSSPGKVTWDVGELKPQESKIVTMSFVRNKSGKFTTKATAKAHCADTVFSTCDTVLSGIPAVLLEVVDLLDPIEVGGNETYSITVTNQGTADDTNVSVNCMIEDNMEYVSSTGPTKATVVGKSIKFASLSSLAPKSSAKWHVTVKALDQGDIRFKVVMNSDQLKRSVEETEATRFYKEK